MVPSWVESCGTASHSSAVEERIKDGVEPRMALRRIDRPWMSQAKAEAMCDSGVPILVVSPLSAVHLSSGSRSCLISPLLLISSRLDADDDIILRCARDRRHLQEATRITAIKRSMNTDNTHTREHTHTQ